jgi:hypothetical protein
VTMRPLLLVSLAAVLGCASLGGGGGGGPPATDQPMHDLTLKPLYGRAPIRLESL